MSKPFILCIDDERFVLNSLKEQLKSRLDQFYNVEVAENGEEALALLNELLEDGETIPLIICDYIMPGMKGDELLEHMHGLHPKAMKILLTGQATLDGVKNIINKTNLYRFISKPWDAEDLVLSVKEAIKSYDREHQIAEQNILLEQQNKELLMWSDAFVLAMGTVLDTRDVTTAGHSKRMAFFAVELARAINNQTDGPYKDVFFTENNIKELYYASLLHDVGKIGIREQVLLKPHRIPVDRQMAITYRGYWNMARLESKMLRLGESALTEDEHKLLVEMAEAVDFIKRVNHLEILEDDDILRLKEIAKLCIWDIDGLPINLLSDDELKNLSVKKGTLTEEERLLINRHVEFTYDFLKDIPWPEHLRRVPDIASSHHERINGKGYHKGLQADEVTVQARILAILDIYEALTSNDRPYRKGKRPEEALQILWLEVQSGHLDKDILNLFVEKQIYQRGNGKEDNNLVKYEKKN